MQRVGNGNPKGEREKEWYCSYACTQHTTYCLLIAGDLQVQLNNVEVHVRNTKYRGVCI